jgi:hypothetical protein
MTVRQAVADFLDYQRALGRPALAVAGYERGLRRFLDRRIRGQRVDRITPRQIASLTDRLSKRLNRRTQAPFSAPTQRTYTVMAGVFFEFCIGRGLMLENPMFSLAGTARATPLESTPAQRLGRIVRDLRDRAHLTREQLSSQTGLCAATVRNIEMASSKPSRRTLHRLMTSPAMATLPERVRSAGLAFALDDGDTAPGNGGARG